MKPAVRRILVVDEHPVIVSGLARLLEGHREWELIGGVDSCEAALDALRLAPADLVVLEPAIQGLGGLGRISEIAAQTRVLCFSMLGETFLAERALREGARGYLSKTHPGDEILAAIGTVLDGGIALSEAVRRRLIGRIAGIEPELPPCGVAALNNRELRVVHLLGANRSTRQIAAHMRVSEKTVATHRQRIREKLQLRTSNDLVRLAASWAGQEALS
jgi:DNA-binding NarL/FixJ family response regulator